MVIILGRFALAFKLNQVSRALLGQFSHKGLRKPFQHYNWDHGGIVRERGNSKTGQLTMSADVLTNVALPTTSATLTLRIIKSFEYRTERSLVLHGVNLETTTAGELKNIARQGIVFLLSVGPYIEPGFIIAVQIQPGWKPYRNVVLGMSFVGLLYYFSTLSFSRHHQALHKGPRSQGL
jgi:hypothetical protein